MIDNTDFFSASEIEELRKAFFAQAHEILENLQDALLQLEKVPEDAETLKAVKRFVHTLKGDANSIGLTEVGTLCHSLEDLLIRYAEPASRAGSGMIEVFLSAVDVMQRIVSENERGTNGTSIQEVMARIAAHVRNTAAEAEGSRTGQEEQAHLRLTEYQSLQAAEVLQGDGAVFDIEVDFHALCRERSIAIFMVRHQLSSIGRVIATVPEPEDTAADTADNVSFVLASEAASDVIRTQASVAGITAGIRIRAREYRAERRSGTGAEASAVQTAGETLRIDASKIDRVMNLVGELIIGRSMIEQISHDAGESEVMGDVARRLASANAYLGRTVSDLQMVAMKMRMVPVNQVFRKFPKIVRDLSAEKNKSVQLVIRGKETELDKSIVDALGEPLSHIIRNSIDHGIEDIQTRKELGKSEEATIGLSAYHEAARIVIEISDDGRGIDAVKLREKAIAQGFITQADAEKLSDQEAMNLIFYAGLSTAEVVSETSGRGVGMDAVKAAVEGMKGTIEVESARGTGTTFRLRLPLTLAVIKALLVEVSERSYAIPVPMVSEVIRVSDDTLLTVDGREVIRLRDRIISVVRLNDLFGYNDIGERRKTLVILSVRGGHLGLLVDRLTCQQELVIKAINTSYTRSELVSGASILGNGRVVLILDVAALFKKAVENEKKRMAVV
ncbi:MAG: chemotaxis protein CheA [Nitrospirae bacterium]|nr:chemotaxis protein CheA [Nitrospirota bacterium]